MFAAVSHLLIGLIGTVLLYVALFLHETEEGKIQNRLEKLWVDIDDLSKAALSRQAAFLQRVSGMAKLRPKQALRRTAHLCRCCCSVIVFRHINVYDGSVILMPKEEPYLLRNIGKENVDLLVIEVRK